MYPPHLLTLAVILLVSSSTFASPAQSSSPSTSTSSITGHSATSYPHDHDHPYSANLHPAESEDTGCRFIAHGRAYDLCALLYLDTIAKAGSIFNGKGKEKARERDIAVVLAGVRKFRFGPVSIWNLGMHSSDLGFIFFSFWRSGCTTQGSLLDYCCRGWLTT
jgi:hypothetical protein